MCGDPVSKARQTRSAADDRTADAVVRHCDVQRAAVGDRANRDLRRRTVLDGVRERLARHEVRSRLDARGCTVASRVDVDGNGRCPRQVA